MWIVRKRIQLPSEKALFLFVGKVLPQSRYLTHEIRVFGVFELVYFVASITSMLCYEIVAAWVKFTTSTTTTMDSCTLRTVEKTLLDSHEFILPNAADGGFVSFGFAFSNSCSES